MTKSIGDMPRIIDSHTHIWLTQASEHRRMLHEAVEQVPLRAIWVSGLKDDYPDNATVAAINDEVAVFLRECSCARGFAYLNPRHGEAALDELRRSIDLGFVGVKLWTATLADDPLNFPIFEAAIENSMPVLLHTFDKTVGQHPHESRAHNVAAAAERYPECTFIMAHISGKFIIGSGAAQPHPNLYVDICGSFGERGMVDHAVKTLGARRVLFGTDMPASDIYHNLGKVLGANLTADERELILWKNAQKILK